MEQLEQKDARKTKKIQLLIEENNQLNIELEEKSLSSIIRDREKTEDDIKPISSPSFNASINLSVNDSLEGFILNEADKSLISDKLEEISKAHKE